MFAIISVVIFIVAELYVNWYFALDYTNPQYYIDQCYEKYSDNKYIIAYCTTTNNNTPFYAVSTFNDKGKCVILLMNNTNDLKSSLQTELCNCKYRSEYSKYKDNLYFDTLVDIYCNFYGYKTINPQDYVDYKI